MGWFTDSKFAFCRGIANHAWEYPPELSYEAKRLTVTLHCHNCGSTRKDRVHQGNGAVETRHYNYADGYLLKLNGEKRPEKSILRHDGLRLLIDEGRKPVTKLRATRRSVA